VCPLFVCVCVCVICSVEADRRCDHCDAQVQRAEDGSARELHPAAGSRSVDRGQRRRQMHLRRVPRPERCRTNNTTQRTDSQQEAGRGMAALDDRSLILRCCCNVVPAAACCACAVCLCVATRRAPTSASFCLASCLIRSCIRTARS
jgi:hypothetical protein